MFKVIKIVILCSVLLIGANSFAKVLPAKDLLVFLNPAFGSILINNRNVRLRFSEKEIMMTQDEVESEGVNVTLNLSGGARRGDVRIKVRTEGNSKNIINPEDITWDNERGIARTFYVHRDKDADVGTVDLIFSVYLSGVYIRKYRVTVNVVKEYFG